MVGLRFAAAASGPPTGENRGGACPGRAQLPGRGGPGSTPRPPPSRRLPGLSPGRGARRGRRRRSLPMFRSWRRSFIWGQSSLVAGQRREFLPRADSHRLIHRHNGAPRQRSLGRQVPIDAWRCNVQRIYLDLIDGELNVQQAAAGDARPPAVLPSWDPGTPNAGGPSASTLEPPPRLIRSRCARSRLPSPCPPSGRRASSSSGTRARRSAARARGSPRLTDTP